MVIGPCSQRPLMALNHRTLLQVPILLLSPIWDVCLCANADQPIFVKQCALKFFVTKQQLTTTITARPRFTTGSERGDTDTERWVDWWTLCCGQDISLLTFRPRTLFSPRLPPLLKRTSNSSGDEIANVNFLYDDIVHVIQNTIDSCIYSATARLGGYVLERMFTKFSEITQCNGHYAVQGHSRSQILAPIESSYTTSY